MRTLTSPRSPPLAGTFFEHRHGRALEALLAPVELPNAVTAMTAETTTSPDMAEQDGGANGSLVVVHTGCFDELVLVRGYNKASLEEWVCSGGASGSAAAAAAGVGQHQRYREMLAPDSPRASLVSGNDSRYYEPAEDHPIWVDLATSRLREMSDSVYLARPV